MVQNENFTQREIAVAINNTFTMASRPVKTGPFGDSDRRRLREFAEALLEPIRELLAMPATDAPVALTPEKAVYALLAAALFVQTAYVQGRPGMLPSDAEVREVLNVSHK